MAETPSGSNPSPAGWHGGLLGKAKQLKDWFSQALKDAQAINRLTGEFSGRKDKANFSQAADINSRGNAGDPHVRGSVDSAVASQRNNSAYQGIGQGPTFTQTMPGGGQIQAPMPIGYARVALGTAAARDAAGMVGSLLPNAPQGIDRQQLRFHAGTYQGSYSAGLNMEAAVMAGTGGRLSSVNENQRVAVQMGQAGIQARNAVGGANLGGWAALNLGMSNTEAVGANLQSVSNPEFQNWGLVTGVQTTDAQGNRLTGSALYENIFERFNLGGMSREDLQAALQSGRGMGLTLSQSGMSEKDIEIFKAYALERVDAESRGEEYTMEGSDEDASNRFLNPEAGRQELVAAEDEYVETGMEAAVAGYGAMNEALEKTVGALNTLYDLLGPLADAFQAVNGAVTAFNSSQTGGQLKSAFGYGMNLIGDLLAFKGLSALAGGGSGGGGGIVGMIRNLFSKGPKGGGGLVQNMLGGGGGCGCCDCGGGGLGGGGGGDGLVDDILEEGAEEALEEGMERRGRRGGSRKGGKGGWTDRLRDMNPFNKSNRTRGMNALKRFNPFSKGGRTNIKGKLRMPKGGKLGKLGKLAKLGKLGRLASLGKAVPGVGMAITGIMGLKEGSDAARDNKGFWNKDMLWSTLTGAVGGAITGGIAGFAAGGIGAIPGALAGAALGAGVGFGSYAAGYGAHTLYERKTGTGDEYDQDELDARRKYGVAGSWRESAQEKWDEAHTGSYGPGGEEIEPRDFTYGSDMSYREDGETGYGSQVQTSASGRWTIPRSQIYKLHENEMILPADIAEGFRTAVQKHLGGVDSSALMNSTGTNGMVKVEVTLNNASWSEAQKLVRVVEEAIDTSREMTTLAST